MYVHQAVGIYKKKKQKQEHIHYERKMNGIHPPHFLKEFDIWGIFDPCQILAVSQKHRPQPASLESGHKQRSLGWTSAVQATIK